MAKPHLVDTFDNALFQHFNRDLVGDEMAHLLSRITMNWGKVEHALYLSMKSIDRKRAYSWRAAFFSSTTLAKRKDQARKSLREAVGRSYPKLLDAFDDALNDLQDVQHRRNALSHGLWLPIQRAGEYPVQPLRYDKTKALFDPILIVDIAFLGDLLDNMTTLTNRIYSIGSELLAHQQLINVPGAR